MDIFCEYIVKKNKEAADYLITIGIIAAAIAVSIALLVLIMMFGQYLSGVGLLMIFAAWWGAVLLIKSRNVEYEYILTNNELDIDKIIARRGRKRLCTIDFKEVEQCASISDPTFAGVYRNTEGKTVRNYAGDMSAQRVYFADYTKDSQRMRVIFQPSEKILSGLKKCSPRLVTVKDGDITQE